VHFESIYATAKQQQKVHDRNRWEITLGLVNCMLQKQNKIMKRTENQINWRGKSEENDPKVCQNSLVCSRGLYWKNCFL